MYSIKNVEQFLSTDGQGGALDPDVKAGILTRAKITAAKNGGIIMGGGTGDIIGDEQIEKLFEDALGSDINQLAILMDLAGSMIKERGKLHPSHTVRDSDASSFDFVCIRCGATDDPHSGSWGKLTDPCSA